MIENFSHLNLEILIDFEEGFEISTRGIVFPILMEFQEISRFGIFQEYFDMFLIVTEIWTF